MPEPFSTAVVAGYSMALYLATRTSSAVSAEARDVRRSAGAIVESAERSIALFGPRKSVISDILAIAEEYQRDGWDGDECVGIASEVVERAIAFIRTLPDDVALPQVAAEADGSISFDWITDRTRVFSLSIGSTNRLAFAWIDGTDRGHGVARFDGGATPPRILNGIEGIANVRSVALGVA